MKNSLRNGLVNVAGHHAAPHNIHGRPHPAHAAELVVRSTCHPIHVELYGDLDVTSAPRLSAELAALPARDTVISLAGVDFCGVPGLTLLLDHSGRLQFSGATLRLACPTPALARMLTRLDLDRALPADATAGAALAALSAHEEAPVPSRAREAARQLAQGVLAADAS